MRVCSTYYYAVNLDSQGNEYFGRCATGVTMRVANAGQVGCAAVDPAVIPYGSRITVNLSGDLLHFIAADTAATIVNQDASGGTAPVVCFFSDTKIGDDYIDVTVVPYSGSTPFELLTEARRNSLFNIKRYS